MDPYNQWGDEQQNETHEMNERAPINYNNYNNYNQNDYMTNDGREASVENFNIDGMQANQHAEYAQPTKSYYYEMPQESNFWKYSEQLKSISAGCILFLFSL